MKRAVFALVVCAAATARADQAQLDLGLGVLGVGYEAQIAPRLAWQVEATFLTTPFLPLVGGGVTTLGYGAGSRVTWFYDRGGAGLYVAGALRFALVHGDRDGERGRGLLLAPAVTVGQAFHATKKLDLRFGFGAQWIHYDMKTAAGPLTADVPFIMVELIAGLR